MEKCFKVVEWKNKLSVFKSISRTFGEFLGFAVFEAFDLQSKCSKKQSNTNVFISNY